MSSCAQPDRALLIRQGLRLEYLTLAWNLMEALVAVGSGLAAGSIALIGFGLDSVIESFSGAALLWRLGLDADTTRRDCAERRALRLVGASFAALTIYVVADALNSLITREHAGQSRSGIALAIASLIVMPLLARAKRRVARGIQSEALRADSRQTDICAYLSAVLLGGLLLNALLGWWWADPVAALIMAPIIGKEAASALRGRPCSCHR